MNLTQTKILILALATAFMPWACSDLTINQTECARPDPDASANVPPPFAPSDPQTQACIAIHNQSQANVTITLTHEDPSTFDMQNIIRPNQTAIFVVPAGQYQGTESYPVLVEHQGDFDLKKGRCYEWLVGEEPQED